MKKKIAPEHKTHRYVERTPDGDYLPIGSPGTTDAGKHISWAKTHITRNRVALDEAREKEFVARFKKHKCACTLVRTSYWNYWRVIGPDNEIHRATSFDLDLEALLTRLDRGENFEQIDLTRHHLVSSKVTHSGVVCVVCGQPGGIPCPNMVSRATANDIKLQATGTNVHPGHCRKKLRELLNIILRTTK